MGNVGIVQKEKPNTFRTIFIKSNVWALERGKRQSKNRKCMEVELFGEHIESNKSHRSDDLLRFIGLFFTVSFLFELFIF